MLFYEKKYKIFSNISHILDLRSNTSCCLSSLQREQELPIPIELLFVDYKFIGCKFDYHNNIWGQARSEKTSFTSSHFIWSLINSFYYLAFSRKQVVLLSYKLNSVDFLRYPNDSNRL